MPEGPAREYANYLFRKHDIAELVPLVRKYIARARKEAEVSQKAREWSPEESAVHDQPAGFERFVQPTAGPWSGPADPLLSLPPLPQLFNRPTGKRAAGKLPAKKQARPAKQNWPEKKKTVEVQDNKWQNIAEVLAKAWVTQASSQSVAGSVIQQPCTSKAATQLDWAAELDKADQFLNER